MQVVDLIFTLNIGFADFIRLCAYLAPNLMLFSIPMASTMGVIIAFARFASDNEMIALKACGISLYKMLPPVIVFATCTALFTGFFSTRLIPAGTVGMQNLFIKLATEKIDKGIQEKRFSEETGDIILYVEEVDKETKEWTGVYLSDLRDKEHPVTIIAQNGRLAPHLENMYVTMNLLNGTLHRTDEIKTQTIKFDRYSINIPIEPPRSIGGESTGVTKHSLGQKELLEYSAKYGLDNLNGISFLVEYHKRIVLSVGCFILTLLGLPIALRSRAGGKNLGIPLGLLFFILYYVTVSAAKGMCDSSNIPIAVIMWSPNVLFGAITLVIILITAREKWDQVTKFFYTFFSRLTGSHA